MNRLEIMEQVIDCEACPLHKDATPVFLAGSTPAEIAIIGDVPGENEPFEGAEAGVLKKTLLDAGFDLDKIAFLSAVACRPADTYGIANVDACRPNMNAQLDLIDPKYVLCVGSAATISVHPDLSSKHGRSRAWMQHGRVYMTTVSVENAIANGNAGTMLVNDIEAFHRIINDPDGQWWSNLPISCGQCGQEMVWMDETGLTWCFAHIPAAEKARAEAWYMRQKAEMRSPVVRSKPSNSIDREETTTGSSHPGTSVAAAKRALPKSGTLRRSVYEYVKSAPDGATDEQIEDALSGQSSGANSTRPRRNELSNDGWLVDNGKRRLTRSGSEAIVWEAIDEGA